MAPRLHNWGVRIDDLVVYLYLSLFSLVVSCFHVFVLLYLSLSLSLYLQKYATVNQPTIRKNWGKQHTLKPTQE